MLHELQTQKIKNPIKNTKIWKSYRILILIKKLY